MRRPSISSASSAAINLSDQLQADLFVDDKITPSFSTSHKALLVSRLSVIRNWTSFPKLDSLATRFQRNNLSSEKASNAFPLID